MNMNLWIIKIQYITKTSCIRFQREATYTDDPKLIMVWLRFFDFTMVCDMHSVKNVLWILTISWSSSETLILSLLGFFPLILGSGCSSSSLWATWPWFTYNQSVPIQAFFFFFLTFSTVFSKLHKIFSTFL